MTTTLQPTVPTPAYGLGMAGWRPWRALREQPEIELMVCALPDGVKAIYAQRGADRAILVNRSLGPSERLAAVAHELVHHERGGGCCCPGMPEGLRAVAMREERRVDTIVATRLLPLEILADFVDRSQEVEPVTVATVVEEFDVAESVAVVALEELQRLRRVG